MADKFIKKLIPYLMFALAGVFFLRMGDESRTPVTIDACDMIKSAGYEDDTAIGLTPDSQFSGVMLTGASYLLDAGDYRIGIAYRTDGGGDELVLYDNGRELAVHELDPDATYQEYPFTLEHSCPDFSYEIRYGGENSILIQSVTLSAKKRFYRDTDFLIIVFLLLTAAFALWRYRFARKGRGIREDYIVLTLLGIGAFSSLPYFNTGLSWAVDLCYHLIRIEGIKDGLMAGQFPVVIYPEALHGNGYLNCMYPNLLLYLPAFLRMKGVSLADSFKFLVILCNFATAFLTYHCARTIGGNPKAALLASLLYSCCPYRYTNIYARGAVGEFLAMTFFPLIFAGLYHVLLGDRKKWGYLVLGMSGLLQTHILSVTLGALFCTLFCVLYLKPLLLEGRILSLCKAALVSLLINLGFLVPFLDFYQNGNLWTDALELGTYQEYTLNLSGLLGSQTTGDYYVLTLGVPLAFCLMISLAYVLLEGKKAGEDGYLRYLFLLGAFLLFMSLNFFPGWEMMTLPSLKLLLEKVQFPWRLLGPASLLFAMTGSICCFRSNMLSRYGRVLFIALAGLCMLSATRFKSEDFAYPDNRIYTRGHESKLIGIPKGANTVVYPFEWRPRHTVDSDLTTEPSLSDSSQISLQSIKREGTTTTLQYSCLSEDQYIEVPVIYYMGYEAVDENGAPVPLESGYNNRIRVTLSGDAKPHTVTLSYRIPLSYTLSAWISILSAAGYLLFLAAPYLRRATLTAGKENNDVR